MTRIVAAARRDLLPLLALFIALGGTAVALPGKNSVDSGDIENKQVKSADLRDGTVAGVDLKDGGVESADIQDGGVRAGDLAPGTVPQEPILHSVREVEGPEVTINSGAVLDFFAECLPSETITGGGYIQPGNATQAAIALVNGPDQNPDLNRWFVRVRNTGASQITARAYVFCAS